MRDAVLDLVHDHAALNRRILAIGGLVRQLDRTRVPELVAPLRELREELFLHFAREEEGLFPFVAEAVSDLADRVHEMALAHDAICGALVRMIHLANTGGTPKAIAGLHGRFERAYAAHAKSEAELLDALQSRLDPDQRSRLAALVDGL
jgi:iron-sulfur cluster repair protein YtfE (RIC family)